MDRSSLYLIVHDAEDLGFWLHSPNVPGLSYSRPTADEFRDGLDEVLEWCDAPDLPRVILQAHHFATPEGREYLVYIAQDDAAAERTATADILLRALTDELQRGRMFSDAPRTATGETIFIIGRLGDSVDWVAGALRDGEAGVAVAPIAVPARGIWTVHISSGDIIHVDDARVGFVQTSDSSETLGRLLELLPTERRREFADTH